MRVPTTTGPEDSPGPGPGPGPGHTGHRTDNTSLTWIHCFAASFGRTWRLLWAMKKSLSVETKVSLNSPQIRCVKAASLQRVGTSVTPLLTLRRGSESKVETGRCCCQRRFSAVRSWSYFPSGSVWRWSESAGRCRVKRQSRITPPLPPSSSLFLPLCSVSARLTF